MWYYQMDKIKVFVEKINIGKHNTDSMIVSMNNKKTLICFDKSENITQYENKEIYLYRINGIYKINSIKENSEYIDEETESIEKETVKNSYVRKRKTIDKIE